MPPKLLFDISSFDLNHVVYGPDDIRQMNPHRGHMEMLQGVVHLDHDTHRIVGYKDIRSDEFWVDGHIPGRPLFPGVLMIETGAQLASFYTKKALGWKGFVGFGAVDGVKFRQQVTPGCRMYVLGERVWERHHRICCQVQGVVNGNMAFEATIVGTEF